MYTQLYLSSLISQIHTIILKSTHGLCIINLPPPLYSRFASDLLLWQPASPSTVEKANAKSMLFSCMDVLQPAATQEDRFQMCKSVLKEGKMYVCVCMCSN